MIKIPASQPTFSDVHISAKIDFIKLFSPTRTRIKASRNKVAIRKYQPEGRYSEIITIHDFVPQDLEQYETYLTDAVFNEIEMTIDFRPSSKLDIDNYDAETEFWRKWLIKHTHPFDAKGIQYCPRKVRGNGENKKSIVEPTLGGLEEAEDIPAYNQTFYIGHEKSIYADPSKPNYGFIRIYGKRKDQKKNLDYKKWSARIEVRLNKDGCAHLGLRNIHDLKNFNFRKSFSPYFRMTLPKVKINNELSQENLAHRRRRAIYFDWIKNVGAYALFRKPLTIINRLTRHTLANERIGNALKNLTNLFKTGK